MDYSSQPQADGRSTGLRTLPRNARCGPRGSDYSCRSAELNRAARTSAWELCALPGSGHMTRQSADRSAARAGLDLNATAPRTAYSALSLDRVYRPAGIPRTIPAPHRPRKAPLGQPFTCRERLCGNCFAVAASHASGGACVPVAANLAARTAASPYAVMSSTGHHQGNAIRRILWLT